MKKISTIVPVYNEEKNVLLMHKALKEVAAKLSNYDWEFIYVNDGSSDNSWLALEEIAKDDSRVVALDFSRNFGKELALTAGVQNCTGDAAIFLDADLQHPPALIPEFVKKWEEGAEVVASIRKSTEKKSFIKNAGSHLYYKMVKHMGGGQITENATDFKLIDKKVIEQVCRFTEHKRMFRGLIEWLGFKTEYIEFVAPERINGVASYSFRKLLSLAINSITSFSLYPLKVIAKLGLLLTTGSFLFLLFMLYQKFFGNVAMFSPLSYVIVVNTLVLGIVLMSQGFLALYIGQIHSEVLNRPLYVVREKLCSK